MIDFTIHNDPAINARIQSDLDKIIARLKKHFPDMIALFLVGGFGRGEGAVLIDEEKIQPVNDYDLEMITHQPINRDLLHEIGEELATEIGISWVHIENHTPRQLRLMKFTMYNYDFRYGHHLLAGNGEIINMVPDMDASKMPWIEAERLFFTRLWCFFGPFRASFLSVPPTPEEAFFLANQLSKAMLACVDSILILSGQYHISYRERLRRVKAIENLGERFIELADWAFKQKLTPEVKQEIDLVNFYFEIKQVFLASLRNLFEKKHKTTLNNWASVTRKHLYNFDTLIRRMYFSLVKRSPWYKQYLYYTLAQPFILEAFSRQGIDVDNLILAEKMLKRITSLPEGLPHDWEGIRAIILALREKIW